MQSFLPSRQKRHAWKAQVNFATLPRSFWSWEEQAGPNASGYFPYTPGTNLLYGLREAIAMLHEEGLERVFARHDRHAEATRRAVATWGLETQCRVAKNHSSSLTAGAAGTAEPSRRGATLAVHSSLGYAGGFVGPLMMGWTLDLSGGMSTMGWGLSFNITNLTDQEPSIVANATGQSIVLGHDALGRRYQLSFNMDF